MADGGGYLQYKLTPANAPDPNAASNQGSTSLDLRAFKDLKLDLESWDIVTPLELVEGADAIAQRIAIRLRMILGEWFLDLRVGVPYKERVFRINVSAATLKRIFTAVIQSTPGVLRVDSMSVTFDRKIRRAVIDGFKITLTDGSTLTNVPEAPFIV